MSLFMDTIFLLFLKVSLLIKTINFFQNNITVSKILNSSVWHLTEFCPYLSVLANAEYLTVFESVLLWIWYEFCQISQIWQKDKLVQRKFWTITFPI